MLFHSWAFVLFFIVVFAGFWLLRPSRWVTLWLLGASYFFYGWWNPLYLLLIVYSTGLDYVAGIQIEKRVGQRTSKWWLAGTVVNNLFLLGFFKYGGFVTENINAALAGLGSGYALAMPDVLLPVGISFYTFQSLGYSIDVYRGEIKAERNVIRFATFIAFFPQLVAGPIERAKRLLPQLTDMRKVYACDVAEGLSLFVVGLFKKVALADFLALYVEQAYGSVGQNNGWVLLLGTYAFAWQIYFDFSGYTDMARGIARMIGVDLMLNFRNPYLATGLREFWQRWHISLSQWFRDYVYIPLGGNRKGAFRCWVNVVLTMLVAGLWHGAAWRFIVWGAIHAIGRLIEKTLEPVSFVHKLPKSVRQILTFHFVCLAWVFFRAESVEQGWQIVNTIVCDLGALPSIPWVLVAMVVGTLSYVMIYESAWRKIVESRFVRISVMTVMVIYLVMFASSGHEPFIYFQF